MQWGMKIPTQRRDIPGGGNQQAMPCATSERGEYVIGWMIGTYAVYLDGYRMTNEKIESAIDAMRRADEIDAAFAELQ